MGAIASLIVIYVFGNILQMSILISEKIVFGSFYHEGIKVKNVIAIIIFPIATILAKVLVAVGGRILLWSASDNATKRFLNKPINMKKK